MIPYDDKPLVDEEAMAEEHAMLVDKLKDSLCIGQAGFIKAGQFLSDIRKKETYKYEDSSREQTWKEFCSRPDLPLNGSTPEGRVRTAQKIVKVWDDIASSPDVDENLLARIGYTKLAVVAGVISNNPNADRNEWLSKAEQLTVPDLIAEASDGGKTLAEVNDCKHDNIVEVDAFKCDDCNKFFRKDPRIKDEK